MIGTLQRYVTRELLKTFALTAIGLTLTFSLSGGVLNMIRAEVLTTVQMARILGFILPVATTLTLPISALFACAIVYGRFAADNEFDACKSSGINIHKLLAPAVGLSVLIAAFTFSFTNYVIPKFIERLEALVREDIQKLVISALKTQGYVKRAGYVLYAGSSDLIEEDDDAKTIYIQQAAFLELENENLVMCGTADEVQVNFLARTETGDPVVEASMFDVRALDIKRNQYYEENEQAFERVALTGQYEQDPKWLTLNQLLDYRGRVTEFPTVLNKLKRIRMMVRDSLFYKYAIEQLTGSRKALVIKDEKRQYQISAHEFERDIDDLRPTLHKVTINESGENRELKYEADVCSIRVRRGLGRESDTVHLALEGNVTYRDIHDPDPTNVVQRRRIDLDAVALPRNILKQESQISDTDLTSRSYPIENMPALGFGPRIDDARKSLRRDIDKLGQEITGIIHSRLAFSASVLVTLVLAAALGIIFRGGQLLTAFVISFIPGILVVVMNIMGRQLTENTGTHAIGIMVIWAGILLLALADVVVLARYLKR
ncbi:MAG: LptF/LptG family permease [Planctomycetota bacterium]|nr:MAG: LptF/LptG family permease [Planctomycetota bacterium]